ncbi:beta-glucosidase [Rhodoblastus acidophilus]|uniref:beta-glucosidase n=1 Tax=Rhodoblastus acidophilus TaxID=1074 RepID=UPI002224C86E|nr:beta-glucosidase [Rhodoblastus acidophilus]MCW2318671.1 beta-glucosidase [Rhodoblastus acidophilus]
MKLAPFLSAVALSLMAMPASLHAGDVARPWMNTSLSANERAGLVQQQMTREEKLEITRGVLALNLWPSVAIPPDAIPGGSYVAGVPRLGVPALFEIDGPLGVTAREGGTALPSGLAMASTWSPATVHAGAKMIGEEAWRNGFNVLLAGGANLARDPRAGRNFEYFSEDPLLTGLLAGEAIRGVQENNVVSTLKHFALNDQETGRKTLNVAISPAAARETDLLAFELAIERGAPGAVMCSYNRVNGDFACENDQLLNGLLKTDWRYPGWVMSDWGAVHSPAAALRGLDQQSGRQLDDAFHFGEPLRRLVDTEPAYAARLDDMVHRILRSMFAHGLFDRPPEKSKTDDVAHRDIARKIAEEGVVLLANSRNVLPLGPEAKRIVLIGGHSDIGVLSGGGASQVTPPGGPALRIPLGATTPLEALAISETYLPSSPYQAIKAKAPKSAIGLNDGGYPAAAAEQAAHADVAIVFATKWMGESRDAPDLSLPYGQDALIEAVAAANPRTVVVLETGGPVLMPWLDKVAAVVEAWYPGAAGAEAIANVLFGDINPSGHLPMTFPAALEQIPNTALFGRGLPKGAPFDVVYREGVDVGYRWYARNGIKPLFPFGHGLSYTTFQFKDLSAEPGEGLTLKFTVANTGTRAGAEVAQVYLVGGPIDARQRLIGWSRIALEPGQSQEVTVKADPRLLADWDDAAHGWRIAGGQYDIAVGSSAAALELRTAARLDAKTLPP